MRKAKRNRRGLEEDAKYLEPDTPADLAGCTGYVPRDVLRVYLGLGVLNKTRAVAMYVAAGVVDFARLGGRFFMRESNIAEALGLTALEVRQAIHELGGRKTGKPIISRSGRNGQVASRRHWILHGFNDEKAVNIGREGAPSEMPTLTVGNADGTVGNADPESRKCRPPSDTLRGVSQRHSQGGRKSGRPSASLPPAPPDCSLLNPGEEDAPGEAVGRAIIGGSPKGDRARPPGARPKGPKAIDESPEGDVPPPADGEAAKAQSLLAETVRTACLRHEVYTKKGLVHAFFDIQKALGLGDHKYEKMDFSKAAQALKAISSESPNGLPGQERMVDFLVWCFGRKRVPDYVGDLEDCWLEYQPELEAARAARFAADAAAAAEARLAEDRAMVAKAVADSQGHPDARRLMDVVAKAEFEEQVMAVALIVKLPKGKRDPGLLADAAEAHGPGAGLAEALRDAVDRGAREAEAKEAAERERAEAERISRREDAAAAEAAAVEARIARREAEESARRAEAQRAGAAAASKAKADAQAFAARHAAEVAALKAAGRWSDGPAGSLFPEE